MAFRIILILALICLPLVFGALIARCPNLQALPQHNTPQPPLNVHYEAHVIDPNYGGGLIEPRTGDLLLWGSDGVISRSADGKSWQQAKTPITDTVNHIAASVNGARMMAAANGGHILTSTDGGSHWEQVQGLDTTATFNAVLQIPATGTWLAAGNGGLLAFAPDDPTVWHTSTSSISDNIIALHAVPNTSHVLFGGENGLIGLSKDGGNNWRIIPPQFEQPITAFKQVNELTLGLSANGKIVLSRDTGESWQLVDTGKEAHYNDVAYDPIHHTIVIAGSDGNIVLSKDQGHSWTTVKAAYQHYHHYLYRVIYDPSAQRLLAFGQRGSVVQSVDGGSTWQPLPAFIKENFEVALKHPNTNTWVTAGMRGFKATTAHPEARWQLIQHNLDHYWRDLQMTDADTFVAVGQLGQIIHSGDSGAHWALADVTYPDPNTPPSYYALAKAPNGDLFAAGPTGTIMRSQNAGINWQLSLHTPFEQGDALPNLAVHPNGKNLIALEAFQGPYASDDGGRSWQRTPLALSGQLWRLSLLPKGESGTALAVGQEGLMVLSTDNGTSWRVITPESASATDLYATLASTTYNTLFAAGQNGQLLRSEDHGQTWHLIDTGTSQAIRTLSESDDGSLLFATGEQGLMLRSTDGGQNWSTITTPADDELRAVYTEPATGHLVVIGRSGTLLRSQDQGASWKKLASHTTAHFRRGGFLQKTGDFIAIGERIVRLKAHYTARGQ